MRYARLVPIAAAVILVLNLLMVSGADVSAAQRGNDLCVAVSGGTVLNETVLDVVADGGTAIGDSSGGNGNLALTANGGNENARDNGNNNGNNNNDDNGNGNNNRHDDNGNGRHHNRNDWSAQPLDVLEQRLLQTDTASSGNGGVVDAAANGGAVSIQDINSGGNVGNAISIGDTHCAGAAPQKPSGGGGYAAPSGGGGGGGGKVKALPKTGVGMVENGTSESLLLALGALGLVVLSLGYDYQRRDSQGGGR
jgi:hypothetical protein